MLAEIHRFSRGVRVGRMRRLLYSPFLVQMVVTRRCNLACAYCNEHDRSSDPVPVEVLRTRVNRVRDLGAFAIEFTGGEPLLHPDLPALVAHCTALGFVRRMLITNGLLLDEYLVRALDRVGLTDLQISVDGVHRNEQTSKTLDVLGGRLELLALRAGFRVTLNAVIGPTAPEEALEVLRQARAMGFIPRIGLVHAPGGSLCLDAAARAAFRDAAGEPGPRPHARRDYRLELLEGRPAPFKCRAGSRYFYVDERGMVNYCSQQRGWFGKNVMDYTPEDLERQFHQSKACSAFCTIGCARANSALDGWRPQAGPRHAVVYRSGGRA